MELMKYSDYCCFKHFWKDKALKEQFTSYIIHNTMYNLLEEGSQNGIQAAGEKF